MTSHSNFQQKKCWSCKYYSGKQKINRFLSASIETDDFGNCTCSRCPKNGQRVRENDSCSKWEIHSLVSQLQLEAINKKQQAEAKKESQKVNREIQLQQKEMEERQRRERRQIESERRELEEERKRLEYERWYSNLTPAEREAEDLKKAEEAKQLEIAEAERKQKEQEEYQQYKQKLEESIRKEKKKKIFAISFALFALLLAVGMIVLYACINAK